MKNKKGFTLIELLVAMAIIAVLLALAVYGILQVQKNSRETQRRKALEDINIGIQDYYSRYGQYPNHIDFVVGSGQAVICIGISSCTSATNKIDVPLKNSAIPSGNNPTTVNQTRYIFSLDTDGYQLAFCREDKKVENGGTSSTEVQDSSCN